MYLQCFIMFMLTTITAVYSFRRLSQTPMRIGFYFAYKSTLYVNINSKL